MIEYVLLTINLLCAVDIYRDSKGRENGFLYPFLGLVLGLFGLVVYRFMFGGSIVLAAQLQPVGDKPGPLFRMGAVFTILGSLFFLGGYYMTVGAITGAAVSLQAPFLLIAGIIVFLFGGLLMKYDKYKRK
jgi:hypothetical protein